MDAWRRGLASILSLVPVFLLGPVGCVGSGAREGAGAMKAVRYLNPEGLLKNPAFSQVAVVDGTARMVYVGGQNAVDASGVVIGAGDLGLQTTAALENLRTALDAAGADLVHIVKMTVYMVQGQSPQAGYEASRRFWGDRPDPPTISLVFVAGLAHPEFLVEVDAIAAVPG